MRLINNFRIIGLLGLVLSISCKEINISDPQTAASIRAEDLAKIDTYALERDYPPLDTTSTGALFAVLDTGSGEEIQFEDIVTMHYVGKLPSDSIFVSTIDSIGGENTTHLDNPLIFTHSQGGWTLRVMGNTIGFSEGVTACIENTRVGGKGVILAPRGLTGANTVLIYEVYPVDVE